MARHRLVAICSALLVLVLCGSAPASWVPDRRKPQFSKEFGYAVFPYPYSLPGIGQGLGIVGGGMNIGGTYTDAYGIAFGGDVQGIAAGVRDIHLVDRTLILETGVGDISAATIESYHQRGMLSGKHEYSLLELGDMREYGARLTATFLDRRLEIYGARYGGSSVLKSIRRPDGSLITLTDNPPTDRGRTTIVGTRLDLTDDYQDPRRGFRVDVSRWQSPPEDSGPDYYVVDYNATAYVPIGRRSTVAFNYLRSDAHVLRSGETDRTALENELGLTCASITDAADRQACYDVVASMAAHNTFGTASALGGFSRLRSYPASRFQGAHTVFYGSEIRWNLTDESTPYDIFIMRDVRTSWQVALFYEVGSTADVRSEVGDVLRSSYGMGVRMVTASGVVFRADLAAGREGLAPNVFIGYPWEF